MAKMSEAEVKARMAAILEGYEARGGSGRGNESVTAQIWQARQLSLLGRKVKESGWSDDEFKTAIGRHYKTTKQT